MVFSNHLTTFMEKAVKDERIVLSHICLFLAIYQSWLDSGQPCPHSVSRRVLMTQSKIASTSTYHKCMNELNKFGYVRYEPSYHPREASQIHFV